MNDRPVSVNNLARNECACASKWRLDDAFVCAEIISDGRATRATSLDSAQVDVAANSEKCGRSRNEQKLAKVGK